MKSTVESVRAKLKAKFLYLESELEVYRILTGVLEAYNGKKVDKRILELVQEALPKYHVHWYKQDYYIRLRIDKIGYSINKDKSFMISIHYQHHGPKFDFEKFEGQHRIPTILHRKLLTKQLLSEDDTKIEKLLSVMQNMHDLISRFHGALRPFSQLVEYLEVEDKAIILETKTLLEMLEEPGAILAPAMTVQEKRK